MSLEMNLKSDPGYYRFTIWLRIRFFWEKLFLYDATQDPSSKSINENIARSEDSLPYAISVECNRGPNHNLTFLRNQVLLFILFLVRTWTKLL